MRQQQAQLRASPLDNARSTLPMESAAASEQAGRPEGLAALKQRYGRLGLSLSPEASSSSLSATVTGKFQLLS